LLSVARQNADRRQTRQAVAPSPAASRAETVDPSQVSLSAPVLFIHHCVAAASPIELVAAASSSTVDEFYNSSYLSRRAVLGDDFPDIDHSHGGRQPHEYTLTQNDMKVLEIYNAFELPSLPIRQALFEIYHERCWTWMPVVDDETEMADSPRKATSLLVLQAVLLAAASTRAEADMILPLHSQYRRIKAIIDTGAERNPLNLLAALCLIQFYAPAAPKDISTDTPRFWGTYALGLALQMGLNMKPIKHISQEGLRRRVWWTLYVSSNGKGRNHWTELSAFHRQGIASCLPPMDALELSTLPTAVSIRRRYTTFHVPMILARRSLSLMSLSPVSCVTYASC
jgi:hypothetical protein